MYYELTKYKTQNHIKPKKHITHKVCCPQIPMYTCYELSTSHEIHSTSEDTLWYVRQNIW